MGLTGFDCEGVLTIDGISMNRAAWSVSGTGEGDSGLIRLAMEWEQRGEDRVLAGAAGVIPYRRYLDVTTHTLRIVIVGDVNSAGVANVDHTQGLFANIAYLTTNIITPVATMAGTRSATVAFPGQATRTAAIHAVKLSPTNYGLGDNAFMEARLAISIPAGQFV